MSRENTSAEVLSDPGKFDTRMPVAADPDDGIRVRNIGNDLQNVQFEPANVLAIFGRVAKQWRIQGGRRSCAPLKGPNKVQNGI